MFSDFKKKIKSQAPSLRSSKSYTPSMKSTDDISKITSTTSNIDLTHTAKVCSEIRGNQSTPVISVYSPTPSTSQSSPPHKTAVDIPSPKECTDIVAQEKEESTNADAPSSPTPSIILSKSNSIETQENRMSGVPSSISSASSSSAPATPPHGVFLKSSTKRTSSRISLPLAGSEFFLNHNHLKPGDKAELLSYDKTINMYRDNAKRTNDPNIQCDLAIYLVESSKENTKERNAYIMEAEKILKALSMRGHPESQYYLANMYASGILHKKGKPNFGNAFPLFVQAAKHQHVDASYR
jgi:hypothetical protein